MSQQEAIRLQLEQQLARLLTRAGRIEGDLRQTLSPDWPEQAVELENDQVLEGLDHTTLDEVRRIRTALSRITEGTYGTCGQCGQAIAAARLAAIPGAITCLACSNAGTAS